MRYTCLPAVLLLVGLSGCMLKPDEKDNTYIGWYCVDNAATGIKDCEKRLMRRGQPVNDVVYGRLEGGQTSVSGQRWRESLPAMDNTPVTAVNTVDEPGIKIENRGPAPKPSKAFVVWADEGLLAGDKKSDAAAPAPTPPAPPRPAADSAAIAKLPPGFTLQLGAFKQDDQCFNLVSSLGATQHSAQVRHINSQGKPYCIVTYGNFASLEEASRASDELLSRHKKLDTWVRSWASIRNASSED